jgi:hypothetical protein
MKGISKDYNKRQPDVSFITIGRILYATRVFSGGKWKLVQNLCDQWSYFRYSEMIAKHLASRVGLVKVPLIL